MAKLAARLGRWYRGYARARAREDLPHVLGAARATIRRTRYCLLATRASDGATSARVVQPHPPEGSELAVWLGTSPGTRKVRELRGDPHATLVYQDNRRSASVVLQGRVEVVEDLSLRRKYFMPSWIAFFPGGRLRSSALRPGSPRGDRLRATRHSGAIRAARPRARAPGRGVGAHSHSFVARAGPVGVSLLLKTRLMEWFSGGFFSPSPGSVPFFALPLLPRVRGDLLPFVANPPPRRLHGSQDRAGPH